MEKRKRGRPKKKETKILERKDIKDESVLVFTSEEKEKKIKAEESKKEIENFALCQFCGFRNPVGSSWCNECAKCL